MLAGKLIGTSVELPTYVKTLQTETTALEAELGKRSLSSLLALGSSPEAGALKSQEVQSPYTIARHVAAIREAASIAAADQSLSRYLIETAALVLNLSVAATAHGEAFQRVSRWAEFDGAAEISSSQYEMLIRTADNLSKVSNHFCASVSEASS